MTYVDPYAGTSWGMVPPTPPEWSPLPSGLAGQSLKPYGPAPLQPLSSSPVQGLEFGTTPEAAAATRLGMRGLLYQAGETPFFRTAFSALRPSSGVGLSEVGAALPRGVLPAAGSVLLGAQVGDPLANLVESKTHSNFWGDVMKGTAVGTGAGAGVGLLPAPLAPVTVPVGAIVGALTGGTAAGVMSLLGMHRTKAKGGGGEQLTDQSILQTLGATPDQIDNTMSIYNRLKKAGMKDVAEQYLTNAKTQFVNQLQTAQDQVTNTQNDLLTAQAMGRVLQPFMERSMSRTQLAMQTAMQTGHPEIAQQYLAWGDEVADSYATQALMFGPQNRLAQAISGGGAGGSSSLFGSLGSNVLANQAGG